MSRSRLHPRPARLKPDPAGRPHLDGFPQGHADDGRGDRHSRHAHLARGLLRGARPLQDRSWICRPNDYPLCELRSLRSLGDRNLLHHPCAFGSQHHLWSGADRTGHRGKALSVPSAHSASLSHNYLAFPFMAGVVLRFLIWVKDNLPNKLDLEWIKAGGGILMKGVHPRRSASTLARRASSGLSSSAGRFDVDLGLASALPD